MKAAPFLLLALGVDVASTCSHFLYCHCYDSDSTPNNVATDAICNYFGGATQNDTTEYGSNTNYNECSAGPYKGFSWDNCRFRIWCKIVGATGQDSSCRVGQGAK
jgi:hypothetical protein